MNNSTYSPSCFIRILLILLFSYALILPLYGLFSLAFESNIIKVLSGRIFLQTLKQTFYVGIIAGAISLSLASFLAWAMVRSKMPYKRLFEILLVLPMLIPSISHGIGLVLLFGANGIFTNMFGIDFNIYGFKGIIIGSVMYSFPLAYLMISDILKYEDKTAYEAAELLGLSAKDRFFCLTLPYVRKPMISVIFVVFSLIITDYGVPLIIGGKYRTLSVLMFQDVIGMLDFAKGAIISLIFVMPSFLAFLIDLSNKDKGSMHFIRQSFQNKKRAFLDILALLVCTLTAICVLFPVMSFIFLSFVKGYPHDVTFSLQHVASLSNSEALDFLCNSLFIAFCVAFIGTLFATIVAYITARGNLKYTRIFHLLSIISLTIPGLVLGLAYVLYFKTSIIYGTFAILILVNIMHFFAPSYLMIYNTFCKINKDLESVALTLGLKKWHIICDVIVPQARRTFLECFAYFFIMSMVTISAVSFLATFSIRPLSLMLNTLQSQMLFETAAFISLIIFMVNLIAKIGIGYLIKKSHHSNL